MMCRVDPKLHEKLLQQKGCKTVTMKGKEYKGYLRISELTLEDQSTFKQ